MTNAQNTLDETLRSGHAQRIAESLWQVSELYHSGAIEHSEFDRRNKVLWLVAERNQVASDVTRILRKAR